MKFCFFSIFILLTIFSNTNLQLASASSENELKFLSIEENTHLAALSSYDYCRESNGTVTNSTAEFMTSAGYMEGLSSLFCLIENSIGNVGFIDLQTLYSTQPSIAATYVLLGLDLEKLPVPIKTIQAVCNDLKGTSIGYYTSGGWVNKYGVDEICVFPDGSKISTWTLLYISNKAPDFLNLRSRIRSPVLPLQLPYIGTVN